MRTRLPGARPQVQFSGANQILAEFVAQTSRVVAAVQRELPEDFPAVVADSILSGLEQAAGRLAAG